MHFGEQFLDVNSSTLIALFHSAGGRAPGGTWSVISSIDEKSLDETDDHIRCRRNTTTSNSSKGIKHN